MKPPSNSSNTPCFRADAHHRLAIQHLLNHPRAALFMGLGLGKTVCALSAFDQLRLFGEARCALVVAPLRVATLTWPNEVEKWPHLSHLRVASLRTKEGWAALRTGGADIFTINYESLPKLCSQYLALLKGPPAFDTIIFDELTRLKNPKGQRGKQLLRQMGPFQRRWGLTGTPTPNSLMELFAQIRILDDGQRLGTSFDHYKRTYFYPTDYMEYDWQLQAGADEVIYGKIHDIALTLRAQDYSKVPTPDVEDINVHLPDEAKASYKTLEKELLLSMGDDELPVLALNAATLVNKLLQVTGGAVYREDRTVVRIHDAKLHALKKLASKPRLPMLVACNYVHEQERIVKTIAGAKLWPKKDAEQKKFLADWNAKRIPVVVADPRSVGHGLNLQGGAHHLCWYSLPWSRELYDQFNARLVRRGQEETCKVYRLLCPGTVDDAVAETLRQKDEGQQALLHTLTNYRKLLEA